jgi:hypothetical protein
MSVDLRDHRITAVCVTPGFLRSEMMLDHFGVTEANWQEAVKKDRHFAESETPFYIGRAVAELAADPNVHEKAGRTLSSWALAEEYGFRDVDGRQPDWGSYIEATVGEILERAGPANADERFLLLVRYYQVHLEPDRAEQACRIAERLSLPGGPGYPWGGLPHDTT